MKKFVFSLQKMLQYREQILEKEKNSLTLLNSQRVALEQKINDYDQSFWNINKDMQVKTQRGTTILEIQSTKYQLENLRIQLRLMRKELELLEISVDKQRKIVIECTKEVTSLEKLKEKQLEEYNYNLAKAEEEKVAEFISSKVIAQNQDTNIV